MLEDKIIVKLLDLEGRMDKFATKVELKALRDEVMQSQDQMMVILNRLDQERIFTHRWVKDIENKVEVHDVDIKNIKVHLNKV